MSTLAIASATSGLPKVASWFKRLGAHFAAKSMQRKTMNELSSLSDYELNDIGMHRGMIRFRALEAYKIEMAKHDGRTL
jgi:uncharacterized protein YjiS (DUF1127 family)